MKRKRARRPSLPLATMLFLALSMRATPSDPAIPRKTPTPADAASAAEQLARRELAILMAGGSPLSFEGVSPGDMNAALAAQPRRFGLFRHDSAVDARRELLRALPFGAILAAAGERNHVDSLLLAAMVETESQFAPHAVSSEGAVGLMQLLPSTGKAYGVKDLRDPYANVEAGSRYLRSLLDRFKGRPELAIAAYNTGPEVVARYGCVPPFRETQVFVKRVLGRYARHRSSLGRGPSAPTEEVGVAAAR